MKLTRAQRVALSIKFRQDPDGAPSYLAFRRRVMQGIDWRREAIEAGETWGEDDY